MKETEFPVLPHDWRLLGAYAAALIALAALLPSPVRAAEPPARFEGGIGARAACDAAFSDWGFPRP